MAGEVCSELKPSTNSTMAWYIWYLTPTSKLFSCSGDKIFFKACAPKAPNITASNPKIAAVDISICCVIIVIALNYLLTTGMSSPFAKQ